MSVTRDRRNVVLQVLAVLWALTGIYLLYGVYENLVLMPRWYPDLLRKDPEFYGELRGMALLFGIAGIGSFVVAIGLCRPGRFVWVSAFALSVALGWYWFRLFFDIAVRVFLRQYELGSALRGALVPGVHMLIYGFTTLCLVVLFHMFFRRPVAKAAPPRLHPQNRSLLVLAVVGLGVGVVVFGFWGWLNIWGRQSPETLALWEPLILTSSVADNLRSQDTRLVVNSLSVLGRRGSRLGEAAARQLLEDQRGWLHGGLYLARFGEQSVVPYLIKGLRASNSSGLYRQIGVRLHTLTGEDYGTSFDQWHRWWLGQYPGMEFDFDSNLTNRLSEIRAEQSGPGSGRPAGARP